MRLVPGSKPAADRRAKRTLPAAKRDGDAQGAAIACFGVLAAAGTLEKGA